MFTPRSVTAVEADVPSVASYNLEVRGSAANTPDNSATTLASKNQDADPSGTTVVSLDDVLTEAMVGTFVRLYLQEVGPTGALADFQPCADGEGHGDFLVRELPDGAESIVVNV